MIFSVHAVWTFPLPSFGIMNYSKITGSEMCMVLIVQWQFIQQGVRLLWNHHEQLIVFFQGFVQKRKEIILWTLVFHKKNKCLGTHCRTVSHLKTAVSLLPYVCILSHMKIIIILALNVYSINNTWIVHGYF